MMHPIDDYERRLWVLNDPKLYAEYIARWQDDDTWGYVAKHRKEIDAHITASYGRCGDCGHKRGNPSCLGCSK